MATPVNPPPIDLGGALGLLLSHLLLIPTIVVSIRWQVVPFLVTSIGVLGASGYYHICQAFSGCFVSDPLAIATQLDYSQAFFFVPTMFISSVTVCFNWRYWGYGGYKKSYPRVKLAFWIQEVTVSLTLWAICNVMIMFVVLTQDITNSLYPAIMIIGMSIFAALLKIVITGIPITMLLEKYRLGWLLPGILLILVSVVFFQFDGTEYQWAHNAWHACVFSGAFCVMVGIGGLPKKLPDHAYDDSLPDQFSE